MIDCKGISWTSSTEYYDIENGMQITKHKAQSKEYIKIKITKHIKLNYNGTKGHITYYGEYKRNPQQNIEFPNST